MIVKTKAQIHDHVFDEFDNQNLTSLKTYFVVEVSRGYFRVVNDRNEPILYPFHLFNVVDPNLPSGWKFEDCQTQNGAFFMGPIELTEKGFYVRYHDGDPEAIALFTKVYERMTKEENQRNLKP